MILYFRPHDNILESCRREERSEMGNKVGRPKQEVIKDKRIFIRVTEEEKILIQNLAKEKGLTVTELILKALNIE